MITPGSRLGIDGGGSRTRFLQVDSDDRVLARVETGPSNWLSVGRDIARDSLAQGIAQLPGFPDVVCGGFAGAGRPENARFFSDTLQTLLPHARIAILAQEDELGQILVERAQAVMHPGADDGLMLIERMAAMVHLKFGAVIVIRCVH